MMDSVQSDLSKHTVPAHDFQVRVDRNSVGLRLDHFLVQHFPDQSRARIIASIRDGAFVVDGEKRKNSYKLKDGDLVSGGCQPPESMDVAGEQVDFPILYEDDHLLVLSKPPDLVVHPGSGNYSGTLVNGLVYYCEGIAAAGDDPTRPGIVHRLDKDTSGVMVVAKNDHVHRRLVELFKDRRVKKEYLALVHGQMETLEGRIAAAIGRHPVNRQKMAVREFGGKFAATSWRALATSRDYSLLLVGIETGRTHQIRVHMAHLGHPVAGDTVYGSGRPSTFVRQMLHAWRLRFDHPVDNCPLCFTAPLWPDFDDHVRQIFPDFNLSSIDGS